MSLDRIAGDLNSRGIVGKRGGKFHGMPRHATEKAGDG